MSRSLDAKERKLNLTREEEKDFREIFSLVDKDGSGSISRDELRKLLETLAISASEAEIDLMIGEIDKNNDGEIQFEEFVAVMTRRVQASYTAAEVKAAFKVFEQGCPPGYVRLEALERALLQYGPEKMSPDQVKELLQQLEPDQNGLFNYAEFVDLCLE